MYLRELSLDDFKDFVQNNIIGNAYQTVSYAMLKAEEGYDYEFIGLISNQNIIAAALILFKKIGSHYYGYSPRGFLVDYSNIFILETFTREIKEYYKKKGFVFIKINPEIAIGKLNKKTGNIEYNTNYAIISNLNKCGYKKLKSNFNFEALLPRINAIVNLENFDLDKVSKNTRNKVKKAIRKGLVLEQADISKVNIFYDFIKDKINRDEFHYNDLYNVFSKGHDIDFFLVKVDYKYYLINSQNYYEHELKKNNNFTEKIIRKNTPTVINAKMNSDRALLSYKNDITEASKHLNTNETIYVAGAMVIKFNNRITIYVSGYDKELKRYPSNYFLYYAILYFYKDKYKYADLNGVTVDSIDNPYHGLNLFKNGFNPDIYEYIGEFDLVIDEHQYNHLLKSGMLAKEFNKE